MADKLPWFKFYAGDFLSDEKLGFCSLEAVGLWIKMLALMHKSDRRGFLQSLTGEPLTRQQLALRVGCDSADVSRLTAELLHAGVFSENEKGVIYCKRMAKEEQIRHKRSEAGKKGGNTRAVLLKQTVKQTSKQTSGSDSDVLNFDSKNSQTKTHGENALACAQPPRDFDQSPELLAREWAFRFRGTSGRERDVTLLTQFFDAWINAGGDFEIIHAAIKEKRDQTIPTWEFKKNLNGHASKDIFAGARAFVARGHHEP